MEENKQKQIGKWINLSVFEEAFRKSEEKQVSDVMKFEHVPYSDDSISYNDMANKVIELMTMLKGSRVLVCPVCKHDVEKFEESEVFCRCLSCDMLYFTIELIFDRSFRILRDGEPFLQSDVYATNGQQFVRCFDGEKYEEIDA